MKLKFQVAIMEKHLGIMDLVFMYLAILEKRLAPHIHFMEKHLAPHIHIMEKCLAPHMDLFMRDQDQGLPKSPTMFNLWEDPGITRETFL